MYLQTVLKRHKNEITNKVYKAIKSAPLKDDWVLLVNEDKNMLPHNIQDDDVISKLITTDF